MPNLSPQQLADQSTEAHDAALQKVRETGLYDEFTRSARHRNLQTAMDRFAEEATKFKAGMPSNITGAYDKLVNAGKGIEAGGPADDGNHAKGSTQPFIDAFTTAVKAKLGIQSPAAGISAA